MDGTHIIIFARIDDGMGDTCREPVDAYVLGSGAIVYSDGSPVSADELQRDSNKEAVAKGRLQSSLAVVNEKILAIDSGTSIATMCSSYIKAYSREQLVNRKEEIEKQLMEV